MTVAAAWMSNGWIFSHLPEQSGRYWIADGWVWEKTAAGDVSTGYWVDDGWIWGPVGAEKADTDFFIREGWIQGPRMQLPFFREA